jgi:two-component system cell cycle sensor histidine kinase PleC
VRKTRDRLSQQAGSLDFDRDLLKLHARTMLVSAAAMPLLVLAVAAVGRFAGLGNNVTLWAFFTLLCYTIVAFMARRVEKTEAAELEPIQARRDFLIGHSLCGLGWAWFAWLGCDTCQIDQFHVVKAVILLVAMATTAVMASSLGGALIATFAVPVAVYAYAVARLWMPIEFIMATLLIVALPFLGYVARNLNRASWMLLSFRSEKDALIAEVETAKSMSDEARRRAEDANLAKSRFLASMSHELRTPLNAILGFSEVMANEVLGPMNNPTYRDYAHDVHESGQHLLDLINEILDLSRIEAGRYQLNEEPVTLVAIVEDCCHMMELKARNKDIRVTQEFETTLPRLYADERAVRQIALNLLSNAIKFTPSGGSPRPRRLDRWWRPVHLRQGQWPRHTGRGNPGGAFRLRSGLDRHQERRAGNRAWPADRPGPARHAWR